MGELIIYKNVLFDLLYDYLLGIEWMDKDNLNDYWFLMLIIISFLFLNFKKEVDYLI